MPGDCLGLPCPGLALPERPAWPTCTGMAYGAACRVGVYNTGVHVGVGDCVGLRCSRMAKFEIVFKKSRSETSWPAGQAGGAAVSCLPVPRFYPRGGALLLYPMRGKHKTLRTTARVHPFLRVNNTTPVPVLTVLQVRTVQVCIHSSKCGRA